MLQFHQSQAQSLQHPLNTPLNLADMRVLASKLLIPSSNLTLSPQSQTSNTFASLNDSQLPRKPSLNLLLSEPADLIQKKVKINPQNGNNFALPLVSDHINSANFLNPSMLNEVKALQQTQQLLKLQQVLQAQSQLNNIYSKLAQASQANILSSFNLSQGLNLTNLTQQLTSRDSLMNSFLLSNDLNKNEINLMSSNNPQCLPLSTVSQDPTSSETKSTYASENQSEASPDMEGENDNKKANKPKSKKKKTKKNKPVNTEKAIKDNSQILSSMSKEIEELVGFTGIDLTKVYLLLTKNENDPTKAVTRVLRNRSYYRKFFAVNA
jgi:hypothetical protein